VLFFTPFEAAAWTILGQRIRTTQAVVLRRRLAAELGERGAFPAPDRLAALAGPQPGLSERKVEQLQALGRAAAEGRLSRERLRGLDPDEARHKLQELPGVGPFSAELILIRGVGLPDELPRHERRFAHAARGAYDLPGDADIEPIADAWRPFRAWITLLLRARLEAAR
jgi:DNA-3-methyladenine glycosylase II